MYFSWTTQKPWMRAQATMMAARTALARVRRSIARHTKSGQRTMQNGPVSPMSAAAARSCSHCKPPSGSRRNEEEDEAGRDDPLQVHDVHEDLVGVGDEDDRQRTGTAESGQRGALGERAAGDVEREGPGASDEEGGPVRGIDAHRELRPRPAGACAGSLRTARRTRSSRTRTRAGRSRRPRPRTAGS